MQSYLDIGMALSANNSFPMAAVLLLLIHGQAPRVTQTCIVHPLPYNRAHSELFRFTAYWTCLVVYPPLSQSTHQTGHGCPPTHPTFHTHISSSIHVHSMPSFKYMEGICHTETNYTDLILVIDPCTPIQQQTHTLNTSTIWCCHQWSPSILH